RNDLARGPKPEVIPANERRRAPLPVRLAVETSWQSTCQAGLDPANLASVFVSGIGDTQLTDYMCRTVTGDNTALSPTKFHNSVHNAAAGYWTISTGCMQAANSVAGFQESVSLTLMEGLVECQIEQRPILLTFYDAPSSKVLQELLRNEYPFSASIIIAPAGTAPSQPRFVAEIDNQGCEPPDFSGSELLEHCYEVNPAAKILPLLKILATQPMDFQQSLSMPLSLGSRLTIKAIAS
ncbi:MAG: hypothetical protein HKN85_10660, partial [Gammaproteobacteria bacterium]|nr:hypothetical protein [Gammaproteobacteria bacterium]